MIYATLLLMICDPALTALFTPAHPRMGRYEVCTTSEPIEQLVASPGPDAVQYGPLEALEAREAFGAAGPYNRSALARLYGGTRVRVARGWSERGDALESVSLLSPYPDTSLTHLLPGTMAIRWTVRR